MCRHRYIRCPRNLPHRLTLRDIRIIQTIDQYKYLTSHQISDLNTATKQAINKRLKLLFNNHFLGKLPAQLSPKLFNSPDVYFVDLDRCASRKLANYGTPLPSFRRSRNKQPKREYLQHTLLTNDILIAFELATRKNPKLEFMPSHTLLGKSKKRAHSHPWKVTTFLPEQNISRTAYPDSAFVLHDRATGTKQLFLIEADRMTQPLARKKKKLFRVSNIKAKLIIYHTAWKQGVFRERLKFPATRILFVTLSKTRAGHMRKLAEEIFSGRVPAIFIFTDADDLHPSSPFWKNLFRT